MAFPVKNIRELCKKRKTSLKQIERELEIGNGVIAKWEFLKKSPPYDTLASIAAYFGVTVDELYNGTETTAIQPGGGLLELTVTKFLNLYRQLWPENKKQVLDYVRFLLGNQESAGVHPLEED